MKAFHIIPLTLSFIIVFSCKHSETPSNPTTHEKHWSYSGETSPEHWIEIERNSDCDGKSQSPINIIHKDAQLSEVAKELLIQYSPTTLVNKVENNGHSIQFDFEYGDSIFYKNETFFLKQIHFHEPSEHKINGVIYPIEMHLVHVSKTNKITVLRILGEEGEESELFEFLESFLPLKNGNSKTIHQKLDLSSLFKNGKSYYSYEGSLTTPPCSEGVHWVVFKTPIILSEAEVLKLQSNMPVNNYRNQQALNNRIVTYHR
ncbi:carbonic anhydrase family protein [Polaribacter sp. BAL334]|uniref:carbonic anhydrase n=1 Tax=Polaribacter sp. BAL334 TaxID=1708178 RepID=UPI0018D23C25|nr:carbonic anhydrase family protein [Polaribacter sp. BAL334]MBG7612419.1 carbonic anhydrase family protein [Polaribacter sp. BAL334]